MEIASDVILGVYIWNVRSMRMNIVNQNNSKRIKNKSFLIINTTDLFTPLLKTENILQIE